MSTGPDISTAEQLAQSAVDAGVVTDAELRVAFDEAKREAKRNGGEMELKDLSKILLSKEYLTNYQLDRLTRGLRDGYFYGPYKVLYCIGSGTFARVFRAVDTRSGEQFAVKVLRARHSNDPKEADLFRREGELCKKLKHESIVPIHEVHSKGNTHFIVMDFVEGRNLREFWKVRKKFDPIEASNIISDMLGGLHYALQQGVTHRDLKMSNVLVSSEGRGMLVDFGLAGLDAEAAGEAANQRSIDYAGLERATNVRRDDPRSDVFFAGCIFYQMLAGSPPLSETRDRVQRLAKDRYRDIKPILELAPDVPMPVAMVVSKAIEFDPDRRYQKPGDMRTDLMLALKRMRDGTPTDGAKKELVSQEGIGPDGNPRRIMVVESGVKRQDLLRELFKRNGYRVLVAGDANRALERFVANPDAADVVLFCAASIGANAVHAFNQFGADLSTQSKPAILLLEEAQGPWAESAQVADHRGVAVMPLKLRKLRELVLAALNAGQASKA